MQIYNAPNHKQAYPSSSAHDNGTMDCDITGGYDNIASDGYMEESYQEMMPSEVCDVVNMYVSMYVCMCMQVYFVQRQCAKLFF